METYYPGATQYEIAGFFYWQGDKNRYNTGHAARYELNLFAFIKALRKEFNVPRAKFVCSTLGQTYKKAGGNEGHILRAHLAVDGKIGKYPEFKGNVASLYAKPFTTGVVPMVTTVATLKPIWTWGRRWAQQWPS